MWFRPVDRNDRHVLKLRNIVSIVANRLFVLWSSSIIVSVFIRLVMTRLVHFVVCVLEPLELAVC